MGDVSKCLVIGFGIVFIVKIGEEVGFVVDVKIVGKGKVICIVLILDGIEVEVDVIENEDGIYDIFYIVVKLGIYVIYVCFGGVDIFNSFFIVMVIEEVYVLVSDMNGLGFKFFDLVILFVVRKGEIIGEVYMFFGKMVIFEIVDNKDGMVIVRYVFIEVGFYEMYIKYMGSYIFESLF